MASVIMADAISKERIRAETFLKAFHEAFLVHKVVCLVAECVGLMHYFLKKMDNRNIFVWLKRKIIKYHAARY